MICFRCIGHCELVILGSTVVFRTEMIEHEENKEVYKERLDSDKNVYESVTQWILNVCELDYEQLMNMNNKL